MEKKNFIKTGNSDELTVNANTDNFRIDAGDSDKFLVSSREGEFELTPAIYYDWQPQEDITTYELAQCIPIITAMQTMGAHFSNWEEAINGLPKNCQRHFAKVEG